MAIVWSSVGGDIVTAIGGIVGAGWQTNYPAGLAQIQAIVTAGAQIEAAFYGPNPNPMPQADYDTLKVVQQRALEGVLIGYQGIGLIIAQQAAAAAWQALIKALSTAYPALGFVL